MLMAKGTAVLCLSEKLQDDKEAYGIIQLTGSINSVASNGDYVFAASGKSGFQIIKQNRPSQSLVTRCADLLAFSGKSKLKVPTNENQAFSGSKRFDGYRLRCIVTLCCTDR